jgi:Mce-associated membrane protein
VEDQPADPGDLTTDAELPVRIRDATEVSGESDATEAKVSRRRHRMPLRGALDADGSDDTATDVASQATDVSTNVTGETVEPTPVPRRRWFSLRRRPKTAEPESISEPDETALPDGPEPAARRPVGKARRTLKEPGPLAEQAEAPTENIAGEAETAETAPEELTQGPDEPADDVILVPHRPAGKRVLIAATAAAVLFVAGAAFAGATLQPYLANRAAVDTKLDVARTAASAISTLWTYTPDNMEALPDRAAGFLGGDFADEYRKYIDAIVAPNKQAQVTNTTQVMGAAVESLTPTEATAIVYTNSVATSPVTKNIPSLRYLSYRLTMQRHDAKWLITRMSTITSFDLTPQL